jgi:hypothetical protein
MNWIKRVQGLWNLENIKIVRRIIVTVIGATVLLIGIALLVLPFSLPNTHGRDAG